jgi:hypothetical protein
VFSSYSTPRDSRLGSSSERPQVSTAVSCSTSPAMTYIATRVAVPVTVDPLLSDTGTSRDIAPPYIGE